MITKPQKAPAPKKKASKKKRRKKGGRYHTGVHNSPKCPTPVNYRSGWELTVCHYLDADPTVIQYTYESVIITYTANLRSKKIRKYFPDFMVFYKNGTVKMVEVKRQNMLSNPKVQKKAEAARLWCEKQNPPIQYEFWTDNVVLPLQKAEKIRAQVAAASK